MSHLSEEQLVLHYYADGESYAAVETHLSECEICRLQFETLRSELDAIESPVPERGPEYGAEVWRRLEARLPERRVRARFSWLPVWAPAAAVAALVVMAFLAGNWYERNKAPKEIARGGGRVAERILVIAVGDHLDRSQMVLAEIANANPGGGLVDISEERQLAHDLLGENRLYRQTATRTGDAGVASVLDDLERVLVEIANSPDRVSSAEFQVIRNRIESQGLLFKVRVMGSRLRANPPPPAAPSKVL